MIFIWTLTRNSKIHRKHRLHQWHNNGIDKTIRKNHLWEGTKNHG